MANEIKTMNIYEKLLSISTELKAVQKNLEVSMGKGKYKAVGEIDVLNAVKPLEAKYRVYSYPCDREVIESGTIDSKDNQGYEKHQLFERIKVTYRFVNVDNPTEFITMVSYGDGIDNGDKSVGKAMTYADKYALLKAYKIMTGEDPDQEASEELRSVRTYNAPNRAKNTPNSTISNEDGQFQGLDPILVKECQTLNIDLEKVKAYYKKDTLTNADLFRAINQKKDTMNK